MYIWVNKSTWGMRHKKRKILYTNFASRSSLFCVLFCSSHVCMKMNRATKKKTLFNMLIRIEKSKSEEEARSWNITYNLISSIHQGMTLLFRSFASFLSLSSFFSSFNEHTKINEKRRRLKSFWRNTLNMSVTSKFSSICACQEWSLFPSLRALSTWRWDKKINLIGWVVRGQQRGWKCEK